MPTLTCIIIIRNIFQCQTDGFFSLSFLRHSLHRPPYRASFLSYALRECGLAYFHICKDMFTYLWNKLISSDNFLPGKCLKNEIVLVCLIRFRDLHVDQCLVENALKSIPSLLVRVYVGMRGFGSYK